jgi:hypothetical protein
MVSGSTPMAAAMIFSAFGHGLSSALFNALGLKSA